jgi:hypothetical protein
MTHSDLLKIKVIVKDTTGNVDDENRHKSIYLYSETFLIKISLKHLVSQRDATCSEFQREKMK